jgi:hypothetical protein
MSTPGPEHPPGAFSTFPTLPSAPTEESPPERGRWLAWTVAAGAVLLVGLVLWLVFGGTTVNPGDPKTREGGPENPLADAKVELTKETDLSTCRTALQQINNFLTTPDEKRQKRPQPPSLDAEQRQLLQERFGLDESALAELEAGTYTLLDGQYLAQCFLLRDAARAIEVGALPNDLDVRLNPLERARIAFDWVMREVRLQTEPNPLPPDPPAYVLRRGWGTALERALVFLALLEQLEPQPAPGDAASQPGEKGPPADGRLLGCLVYTAERSGGTPRLWACGVIAGKDDALYLFDPRLGLPLPGKAGPVATLAEAARDKDVLEQLNVEKGQRYDVDADQTARAEVRYVTSLSALAPRMKFLQESLLGAAVPVQLYADSTGQMERLGRAAKASGLKEPVRPWQDEQGAWKQDGWQPAPGVGVLRRFLPPPEGGTDTSRPGRLFAYGFNMVPWREMPDPFGNEAVVPRESLLGLRIREGWARPWARMYLEPNGPRDLILRGRYTAATRELILRQDHARDFQKRYAEAEGLPERVANWLREILPRYADLQRARENNDAQAMEEANRKVEALWQGPAEPVRLLLHGKQAPLEIHDILYLLSLCKHEEAAQLQHRLELRRRGGAEVPANEVNDVRPAWSDAPNWWDRFLRTYPASAAAPAARRWQSEALARLGDRVTAAAVLRRDLAQLTPLEQVAHLYLAAQVEKQPVSENKK